MASTANDRIPCIFTLAPLVKDVAVIGYHDGIGDLITSVWKGLSVNSGSISYPPEW